MLEVREGSWFRPAERTAVRSIDRFISTLAADYGLDAKRHRWSTGVVTTRGASERIAECRLPVHPYDPDSRSSPRMKGRVRGRLPFGGVLDVSFRDALSERLRTFTRCLDWESELEAGGHDPATPPPTAYRTDLLTRRLLDEWAVDAALFVAAAPHPTRSRRWNTTSSAAESWSPSEGAHRYPEPNAALPDDFPAIACVYDVELVRTLSLDIGDGVRIEPGWRSGAADVILAWRLPSSVGSDLIGRPLAAVLELEIFADRAIVIRGIRETVHGTILSVADPIVPFSGPTNVR